MKNQNNPMGPGSKATYGNFCPDSPTMTKGSVDTYGNFSKDTNPTKIRQIPLYKRREYMGGGR